MLPALDDAAVGEQSVSSPKSPRTPKSPKRGSGEPHKQLLAVVFAACLSTFAMGGVVFGISSLYPLLYSQGFYRTVCHESDAEEVCAEHEQYGRKCCEEQFVRFSLVASGTFFLVDAAAAPWGELADRMGGRLCLLIAALVSVGGFFMLGVGAFFEDDTMESWALMALGLAGPGAFNGGYIGSLELIGDAAPELKATLTSFSAAAFDGSALVFMIFQGASHLLRLSGTTSGRHWHGLALPSIVWSFLCAWLGLSLWRRLRPRALLEVSASAKPLPTADEESPAESTDDDKPSEPRSERHRAAPARSSTTGLARAEDLHSNAILAGCRTAGFRDGTDSADDEVGDGAKGPANGGGKQRNSKGAAAQHLAQHGMAQLVSASSRDAESGVCAPRPPARRRLQRR